MGGMCRADAASRRYFRTARAVLLGSSALCLASALPAAAQDATWSSTPGTGDFNTAANWNPAAVPTGTAFFGTTTGSAVTFSTGTTVGGWTFNPGASAYSFTNSGQSLSFTGAGIDIQGGSAAITNSDIGSLTFNNSSTAGSAVITNTTGPSFNGGRLIFNNRSTAGSATITNRNGPVIFNDASTAGSATILTTDGGFNRVYFNNTSTAGSASITANNFAEVLFNATSTAGSATITTTNGGSVIFDNSSTAGNAAITNNNSGSVLFDATSTAGNASITNNSDLFFFTTSTAGSATITTNSGGRTSIFQSASGGTARFILNGTGLLDISGRTTGATAGSIEGAGSVVLGANNLAVGGNNLSTTFSGVIQDGGLAGGTGGSLTKTGSGTLTLAGANTYTGGTTINAGTLAISADNNLGANTGGLTFTGGTLQFGASFDLANSRTIALNAGGGTFDTNGFNTMVSQAMGGTGALVKAGSGMLTLIGANTHGGGTTISAGALQIGNGGTTGSVVGDITNNAALIFNRVDAVTFGGVISGSGTLQKLGIGTLTLSGISTYTGATTVNGGTLQISGSIASSTVTNNATLAYIGNATAGSASIANNFGDISFHASSKAGSASITSNGNLNFYNTSTADAASITSSGNVNFNDSSSAGSASITNTDTVQFNNSGTAGNASIVNNSGVILFFDSSKAGTARITNNSGGVAFRDTSSAENAAITNNGSLQFVENSTAGNATITNTNQLTFDSNTTAGNAIITNSGNVLFDGDSTPGNAQLINTAPGAIINFFTPGPSSDGRLSAGSIAGNGRFDLNDAELTVGGNNLSTNVTGVLTGTGIITGNSLIKIGTGTMILSGANTYTGATEVNGGTLAVNGSIAASSGVTVNSGATLGGTGTVHNALISGGTLMAGNGTAGSSMTVNGTLGFNAAATYRVNVNPATASFANVSGAATLGGATVNASFAPGSYISKQYTILTAGSISGTFGTLANTNLPANFHDSLSYDAAHAYLNLDLTFTTPASGTLNGNQNNVANALINSFNSNGGIPLTFATLSAPALSQASGQPGASTSQVGITGVGQFINGVFDGAFGDEPGQGGATGFAQEDDNANAYAPKRQVSREAIEAYAAVTPRDRRAPSFETRWAVWASAYGGNSRVSGDTAAGTNTTTNRVFGTVAGALYHFTPDTQAGFALGGAGSSFDIANGFGGGRADAFNAAVYAKHTFGAAYLAGLVGYSWQDTTTDRTVTIAGIDKLHASFQAQALATRLEGGWRYATPMAGITPYAALQATTFYLPSYGETATSGSNIFALNYASKNVTATRSELGAKFDKAMPVQGGVFTFKAKAAWAHDWNTDRSATAIFQTLPGATFTVNGAQPSADAALASLGAEMKWRNGWSLAGHFDGEFSRTTAGYAGKGSVKYAW